MDESEERQRREAPPKKAFALSNQGARNCFSSSKLIKELRRPPQLTLEGEVPCV
jgi:hypothetical protein